MKLRLSLMFVVALSVPGSEANAQAAPTDRARQDVVDQFVAAFNDQDVKAMAALASEDIEWLSVDGKQIRSETTGRAELISSMTDYFKSCPSCRSTLIHTAATAERVMTVEVASWQTARGDRKEQRSIAIYEFTGSRIRRVYYFPAEK